MVVRWSIIKQLLLLPLSVYVGTKRAPSAYNTFMKEEVKKIKVADPTKKQSEAFKEAATKVTILVFLVI